MKINFMPLRMFIRSLIRIFEVKLEDTFVRRKKYSSKLDISSSLIRIFAKNHEEYEEQSYPACSADTYGSYAYPCAAN